MPLDRISLQDEKLFGRHDLCRGDMSGDRFHRYELSNTRETVSINNVVHINASLCTEYCDFLPERAMLEGGRVKLTMRRQLEHARFYRSFSDTAVGWRSIRNRGKLTCAEFVRMTVLVALEKYFYQIVYYYYCTMH